ncbi:hypothetical protein AVEN_91804-1 [Araneus ventricosus]|uniref:Uncharacterized protein n=1 Tax=Araneus ventricosus TaxID=182803 RepID=A0A4Y2K3H9_ARAVE|nr:hypothetical protein AVEN_91804-1 [Araneus ventricosus]
MPGDEVIDDFFQPFLFEVWRWFPHIPIPCVGTLRGIVKYPANSATTAMIAVREVKTFEVGRERAMLRKEDNILSNPVSGLKYTDVRLLILISVYFSVPIEPH